MSVRMQVSDERNAERDAAAAAAAAKLAAEDAAAAASAAEAAAAAKAAEAAAKDKEAASLKGAGDELLERATALSGWASAEATTFDERVSYGYDALGLDTAATKELLRAHRDGWRPDEYRPRDQSRESTVAAVANLLRDPLLLAAVAAPAAGDGEGAASGNGGEGGYAANYAPTGGTAPTAAEAASDRDSKVLAAARAEGPGLGKMLSGLGRSLTSVFKLPGPEAEGASAGAAEAAAGPTAAAALLALGKSLPAALEALSAAWSRLDGSERAYEAALEARLLEHERKARAEETEAHASELRAQGAALLAWTQAQAGARTEQASPAALGTLSKAEVELALAALAAEALSEVPAKEADLPCPSMPFHTLPRPSMPFHDLPRPSATFHDRPQPSPAGACEGGREECRAGRPHDARHACGRGDGGWRGGVDGRPARRLPR